MAGQVVKNVQGAKVALEGVLGSDGLTTGSTNFLHPVLS